MRTNRDSMMVSLCGASVSRGLLVCTHNYRFNEWAFFPYQVVPSVIEQVTELLSAKKNLMYHLFISRMSRTMMPVSAVHMHQCNAAVVIRHAYVKSPEVPV